MSEDRIIKPVSEPKFGPYLARYRAHEGLIKGLKERGMKSIPGSGNKELAGVIDDQRGYSQEDKEWFVKEFQPYMSVYSRACCEHENGMWDEQWSDKFELIALWINYMKENCIVDIENLRVHFPLNKELVKAVEGVSFSINQGETLAVVGESGSGKSSLARALLGIEKAEGNIIFDGRNIHQLNSSETRTFKKDFQIVFQDPFGSLSPRMTIGEIVGEGLRVHEPSLSRDEREKKIIKALEDVELDLSSFSRFPHELSGGQRQRVAIARAIILEPKLILLDEPTSALDVSIQMQILHLLKDLQSRLGLAFLCISHDLKVIRFLSDYVYVMKDGIIVEDGTSEDLFESPKQAYTKELLAASLA